MAKKIEKVDEKRMEHVQVLSNVVAVAIAKSIHDTLHETDKSFPKLYTKDICLVLADAMALTIDAMGNAFGYDVVDAAEVIADGMVQIVKARKELDEKED